jgi:hypothetical protein
VPHLLLVPGFLGPHGGFENYVDAVVTVAIDAIGGNDVRSLRPLVEALTKDPRDAVSEAATQLMEMWTG